MRLSTFVPLMILSCTAHAAERPYAPPRLDNGQPDMQGVWIASNATPLQRPAGFATLVIDEVQAAKLLAAMDARAEDRSTPYYTQPSTGESHFLRRDEPILEYACHEANYSLIHILEGARERERQASQ